MGVKFSRLSAVHIPELALPEDIERAITEMLLSETRDMCGTVSLVASRFNTWSKPFKFRTVIVRQRKSWMKRISRVLLPNAHFIRVLAVDLPSERGQLPEKESFHIQRLLDASTHVSHLAVVWHIWAHLPRECGALQLESLY
ncbi:hypothetical protein B0H19DRAFT_1263554 [Mycena capillaripes]|nr:hypothetical protein B0H19DRAFT_1263554 [Mycena capillaripes]